MTAAPHSPLGTAPDRADDEPSLREPIAGCALPDSPLADEIPGLNACVHCGFCLQACPTYHVWDDENDSPRGRIVLMRSLLEGETSVNDQAVRLHIDRCLGCRACETACPSGVPYGHLLEATRATLAESRPAPLIARAILWAFERPVLLRLAMGGARLLAATPIPLLLSRLPGRFGFGMAMLAASGSKIERRSYTASPATGERRGTFALLAGCVMQGLFAETNRATERTLVVNGYEPRKAGNQRCCGALHAHSGDLHTARELARRNIIAFEKSGADFIVVNAAGCGAMMKEYDHLLRNDPDWHERAAAVASRVRDVSELLAAAGPVNGSALPWRVTYAPPCHLRHGQRIIDAPLQVLNAIPGLQLQGLKEADQCCGSAGIHNLIEPEGSARVLDAKLDNIEDSKASWVVTGNPGCHMQIGGGLIQDGSSVRVVHPVDLLDASYGATRD
jgi:glycolate oxidase iron-sulfur subunit